MIRVLPTELVDLLEWIFGGNSQIVRHSSFDLAYPVLGRTGFLSFPGPGHALAGFLRHSISDFFHDTLFDVWPEFDQRHRTVKANVQGFVEGVVETFHERVGWRLLRIGVEWAAPKGSSIG